MNGQRGAPSYRPVREYDTHTRAAHTLAAKAVGVPRPCAFRSLVGPLIIAPMSRHAWTLVLTWLAVTLGMAAVGRAQSAIGQWNSGFTGEPVLRVRVLAAGFWVIRQSKASNLEAPFMYLVAGSTSALLVDTGSEPAAGTALPLRAVVDSLLSTVATPASRPSFSLLVAHSHAHGDHHYLDRDFAARAHTTVAGLSVDSVKAYFGFSSWPDDEATIDLGARRVTVIPTPGHERAHLMFYDAATRTLLGGDMLYPGLLTIRDWPAFRASTARVAAFARAHAVAQVLGAHVEMTARPREMYPLGTPAQLAEHALALAPTVIDSLAAAVAAFADSSATAVHNDFILRRVSPPAPAPPSGVLVQRSGGVLLYFAQLAQRQELHTSCLDRLRSTLLTVYEADHQLHRSVCLSCDLHGLEDAGAGCDHVIDNGNALASREDSLNPFLKAMLLGFLADHKTVDWGTLDGRRPHDTADDGVRSQGEAANGFDVSVMEEFQNCPTNRLNPFGSIRNLLGVEIEVALFP